MRRILLCLLLSGIGLCSCKGCANGGQQTSTDPQGINPCHRFEFNDCSMTYNGKPFMLGQTIEELVQVFGMYDRRAGTHKNLYFWDNIGIQAAVDKDKDIVNYFYVYFNKDMSDDDTPITDLTGLRIRKKMIEQSPKYFFKGNILVGGVPLGRKKMKIKDFLGKSKGKWSNHPFPILYYWKLDNCDQKIVYGIRTSDDGSGNIEDFYAYITTRP